MNTVCLASSRASPLMLRFSTTLCQSPLLCSSTSASASASASAGLRFFWTANRSLFFLRQKNFLEPDQEGQKKPPAEMPTFAADSSQNPTLDQE